MVLLTITPGIVQALKKAQEISSDNFLELQHEGEPELANAEPGKPISHSQLINLSKLLKKSALQAQTEEESNVDEKCPMMLNDLVRSSSLYVPPPKPKPAKTLEYIALMARLHAEEEARAYERMLHPAPTRETFTQRFPRAPELFSLGATPQYNLSEEEELSYEEVHRQIILIINVLVSIVAVAVFIWVAARHWTVGKRLGLSMGGSFAVAVAEVVVYNGYVRQIREAKRKEKKKPETKKIVKSWVIDKSDGEMMTTEIRKKQDRDFRYRKGKHR